MGGTAEALSGRVLLWLVDLRHALRFWRWGLRRSVTLAQGQKITWYAGKDPGESRPILVCLHGFLDRGYAFRRLMPVLIPVLNSHVRLVVVDLPGFGRSPMPPEAGLWTVEAMARILAEVLERISSGRPVILMSHSVGGALALRLALMGRAGGLCVSGMIAIAPGFGFTRKELHRLQHAFFPRSVAEVQELIMRIAHGRASDHSPGAPQPISDRIARALLHRWSGAGLRMLAHHTLSNPDAAIVGIGALRRCRVPVLLIHGSEDRILPPGHARRIQRALPGAEVHIIDGAGHALHLEAADDIGRIIIDAIRRRFLPGADRISHRKRPPRSGE